jgi:putative peptidoglycan lipid II flippase
VKAALTGVAVNVALKVLLIGSLAQVGLALATAVGAWINLLLVIGFAVRAGYLEFESAWLRVLAKFVLIGVVLAAALWFTARFASVYVVHLSAFRDEAALALLTLVGAIVYVVAILSLFGMRWIKSLVRG